MVGLEENIVGSAVSRGLVTSRMSISGDGGANAGLHLFGRGRYLLGGWCGANSGVEIWQVEPVRALQSIQIEMQLADMSAIADVSGFTPPGAAGNREDWAPHLVPVFDSAVCSAGHRVVVAGGNGVRAFELDANAVQWRKREGYRNHGGTVTSCALSQDGEMSVSTDQNGATNVWVTDTGRDIHRLRVSTIPQCSRFIWQDQMVAVGDDRGRVICWELAGGRRHLQFQTHRGPVHRLHFDRASRCLITAGGDGAGRIWNLEKGAQVGADLQHRGPVHDVSVAMDGMFAVTCGADGYLGIWSMRDGRLLDSYSDGSPLYRLTVDDTTGTVVIAGARSIKSLNVDWARLKELASSASRVSAASGAAVGYGQVPAAVAANYLGQPMQAPVGSILAALQTSDLPIAEKSNAIIARPGGTTRSTIGAPPTVGGVRGATGAVPPISQAHGTAATQYPPPPLSATAPVRQAAQPHPNRPGDPFAPRPTPPGGPLGVGRGRGSKRRETTRVAPVGAPAVVAAADSGMRPMPAAPNTSFADGFFGDSDAAPPSAQSTPLQFEPARPVPEPVAESSGVLGHIGSRPVTPLASGSALEDMLNEDRVQKLDIVQAPKARTSPAVAILFVLALVVGFGGREAVYRYYTTGSALPGELANRPAAIEQEYQAAVARAANESNAARASIEAQIADVAENGQMTESEIERVRGRLRRRFDDAERTRLEAVADAERARNAQSNAVEEQRQALAAEVALQYGGAIGGVVLLVGLIVLRLLDKKKSAPPADNTARRPARVEPT